MILLVIFFVMMGVKFYVIKGDIFIIKFDIKINKFYFFIVKLDVNLEVILWNLVVYEVLVILSFLVFVCYIELMNGIVDMVEDVRILVEEGIIESEFGY